MCIKRLIFIGGILLKKIAVYCGSSFGTSDIYRESAEKLGLELVKRNITLVYGGASVGLMGTVADTVLNAGGDVIGVIPYLLEEREVSHNNLTKLYRVHSMHERKQKMADLADGFITLPGGPGTLEEFAEVFTWSQLGIHQKPIGLLNINNYYDTLIKLLNHMATEGFLQERYTNMALVDSDPAKLIDQFESYEAPDVKTYVKDGEII